MKLVSWLWQAGDGDWLVDVNCALRVVSHDRAFLENIGVGGEVRLG